MNTVIIRTPYDTPYADGSIGFKTSSIKAAVEFLAIGQEYYFDDASDAGMVAVIEAALPAAIAQLKAEQEALRAKGAVEGAAQKAAMADLVGRINTATESLKNSTVADVSAAYKAFSAENAAIRGIADYDGDKALAKLLALTTAVKSSDLESLIIGALKKGAATYEQIAKELAIDEFEVSRKLSGMLHRKTVTKDKREKYSLV